jgi:hypothetical protein
MNNLKPQKHIVVEHSIAEETQCAYIIRFVQSLNLQRQAILFTLKHTFKTLYRLIRYVTFRHRPEARCLAY